MGVLKRLFGKAKKMGKNKNKNKKNKSKNLHKLSPQKEEKVEAAEEAATEVTELKRAVRKGPLKLRFSPTAWAKLLFLRDIGDTEVGGFAITRLNDLLYVEDFILIKQECSSVTVEFDDDDVADFMMDMVEDDYKPEQFMRVWIHTHPNISASPSGTDEDTFERVFGKCDWAIMAIVSKAGDQYCRIQINGGPMPGAFEIPMEVDFSTYEFEASDTEAWFDEYMENVTEVKWTYGNYSSHWPGPRNYNYKGPIATVTKSDDDEEKDTSETPDLSSFGSMKSNIIHGLDDATPGFNDDEMLPGWSYVGDPEDDVIVDPKGFVFVDGDIDLMNSLPDELLRHLTPNDITMLENMNNYEREYVIDDLRKKLQLGD